MSPRAFRRSLLNSLVACLGLLCAVPVLNSQTQAQSTAASTPQPFDATNLREPAGIGAVGVVQGGDNPAFALPDFDDSTWIPINENKQVRDIFPNRHPPIIWQRMHVKVDPTQTGLGLEASGVSQAYEVYVNGQKLIESGKVDPFVQYTEGARIVVSIPDALVKTGSLTVAIRARALPRWWKGSGPSFPPDMILLGQQEAMRDRAWFKIVGSKAFDWMLQFLAIAVCLVGLALFTAQRKQYEYLWLGILGLVTLVGLPIDLIQPFRSLPADLVFGSVAINYVSGLVVVIMVLAFVRQKIRMWLWAFLAICTLVSIVAARASQTGMMPAAYSDLMELPFQIIVTVLIPIALLVHLRRGNREAGILLIPMVFWSFTTYTYAILVVLQQIPATHARALRAMHGISSFSVGYFVLGLGDVTGLLFFLTLAAIIVRRSTRMSRQQALHEGELAAAREIQQVILPEHADPVPGFKVESVYQPAQQVGGDFFQILPDGDGGLLVVVGDVAGKGLPAAMLVSVLVGAIRTAAAYSQSPAEILAQLNDRLVGRTHGGFSTALAARISADGSVTIANAGHLSPYLDGREVELPGALPLGVVGNAKYETTQFYFAPGSRLTFYSDGVVEAQNQKGELFGFDRAKSISTQPAAAIVEAAVQFGQSDDITVVAIERQAAIANAA